MKITVMGLWHLGSVTAACLAAAGHTVIGLDSQAEVVAKLQAGQPPIFEPGLADLVQAGLQSKHLSFTTDAVAALAEAAVLWVAYDTPVDDQDRADTDFVIHQVSQIFPHLAAGAVVLISSQLPVGSTQSLQKKYISAYPANSVTFACSPENLRLGKAIDVFSNPDRVVVGVNDRQAQAIIQHMFAPITDKIEWMSIESAEMTKHALNAFLATSVAFINEIAALCEQVGANAREVERGLKSDIRIGPRAYLKPGAPFAGGTLARDLVYLHAIGEQTHLPTHLLDAVLTSNDSHKAWTRRKLSESLEHLKGHTIAMLGLTYKPGTDTLRRSEAIELCQWLHEQGANIQAYDSLVSQLPPELAEFIQLKSSMEMALYHAEIVVVATTSPEFKTITVELLIKTMLHFSESGAKMGGQPILIDPHGLLEKQLADAPSTLKYITVGYPQTI